MTCEDWMGTERKPRTVTPEAVGAHVDETEDSLGRSRPR
jgi:hypothetical protein